MTQFYDFKEILLGEPAEVENMDSWYGLVFEAADGTKGIRFLAIDFDSTASAQDYFEKMKSEAPPGMQEMVTPIGDASASVEVDLNAGGPGSILVFVHGDKVVQLLSGQSDDQEPLLSLEGLEELPELVASRL